VKFERIVSGRYAPENGFTQKPADENRLFRQPQHNYVLDATLMHELSIFLSPKD
jgi:hypothetical protein